MGMEYLFEVCKDKQYLIIVDIETRTIFIILKKDIKPIEVLEGYFYAFTCGLYNCLESRRIPIVSKKIKELLPLFLSLIEDLFYKRVLILCRIYRMHYWKHISTRDLKMHIVIHNVQQLLRVSQNTEHLLTA